MYIKTAGHRMAQTIQCTGVVQCNSIHVIVGRQNVFQPGCKNLH